MSKSEKQGSSARPRRNDPLQRENLRFAHRLIAGTLSIRLADSLKTLSQDFDFSLRRGELQLLNNSWYVTHTGLLRLARRKRCRGIHVEAVDSLCDSAANRFVLKATVYLSKESTGFVGYDDVDPSKVPLVVRGVEMRIAETRPRQSRSAKIVKFLLVCVSRLASASDRRPPRFVPRRAQGGTRFVDSSSGAPVSRVLRSSLSGWLLFG